MSTDRSAEALYAHHSAPNTVPQGTLLTDLAPRKIFRAAQIMFAKNTLSRKRLPVRLDLEQYRDPSYVYDTDSTEKVEKQLLDVPLTADGMRWIHGRTEVYFYGVRTVDIDYDDFVSKVEISRVGDCFKDVLGINTQVLHRDAEGRPTLQIERIAALAQPTYTAFLGKDELDVYKLEFAEYGPDEQRNWMRTVCSPNLSTSVDDSYMAVSRIPGSNHTKVVFVAHQVFPRPRIMQMFGLDRWIWFRDTLTEAAYRSFWNTTYGNLLRVYEGKEIAIGRPGNGEATGVPRALKIAGVALAGLYLLRRTRRAKRR
ncbi:MULTISPECIES: hypothetical protein [unclassified Crossiella]|uniref:hypothetical protein n=1 Tax=unclassified Crossiella TaxID=2620835 RepID=UPI001FFF1ACF|nr:MULTISPECIES: hypothetical protein [unclassified Crossiella]MCK2239933.1 hypothetical protein [Crossiella sp. S99.2]MCK2252641.1 hypothetical protein [Crossiella sp. S99.1]